MRKVKLLFLMALLVSTTMARAYDFQDAQGVQYTIDGSVAYVSGNQGASGAIVIPASVTINETNYPVTRIGYQAFIGRDYITSVDLSHITIVDNAAFYHCMSLVFVKFGDGLTSIGYSAFSECGFLRFIILPSSIRSLGEGAFNFAERLNFLHIEADELDNYNSILYSYYNNTNSCTRE